MAGRPVALFDFDGTMISGDSISGFVRFCWEKGHTPLVRLLSILLNTLLWKTGFVTVERVKSLALSPLKEMGPDAAEALCSQFALERLLPLIYPAALARMRRHREEGHAVLLVSASPLCYLKYLKDALPVDGLIGTPTDDDYRVRVNVVREEKKRQVLQWLETQGIEPDWARSSSYGDSANDLPMLLMTGNPRLVNPGAKVRRLAGKIPLERWGADR